MCRGGSPLPHGGAVVLPVILRRERIGLQKVHARLCGHHVHQFAFQRRGRLVMALGRDRQVSFGLARMKERERGIRPARAEFAAAERVARRGRG